MTLQTSRKQVPVSAERLSKLAPNWSYANNILNFGCGKFPDLTEECLTNCHKHSMTVTHFDPSSKAKGVVSNIAEIDSSKRRFCVMLCANVLNMHKDLDAAIADMAKIDFDCAVIQIYEGNRSGKGRKTRDGYQRNEPVSAYLPILTSNFHKFDVTLHRSDKCITIVKGRKYYELDDLED
ncbi:MULTISPECIES: hypothetical protein [Vibrio harveyi group]|uniref:Uncharacterized protein n=1 Tax=Vibrio alginolyticus TaxID=663 RepID=A0AA36UUN3_VIBAL|nr:MULTISPECIES: hypothetical protein [Vibrio harveyi group]EGQ9137942.1 hypothetical protein [Vibrio alginolyticus]EHA1205641.1 hypothetical protein [Vibrio alginolyticus]KOE02166.1 hypothetical protein ACS83_13695 [Vibrio alginolyticus]MCR9328760.1 hypothetical protein [Vibrio alginolyticus]MCR9337095.1 hypothetical protein [Vibrio alginolyticus]